MNEDDLVAKGFHRLDSNLIENRPPKINWGEKYRAMEPEQKIRYLEKLAATMNHAAHLIQNERNQLGELCDKKEQQLIALSKSVDANNAMLQQEVTRMNAQRQGFHAEVSKLNTRIRGLEGGSLN